MNIHIYVREIETGRFITHFLYPKEDWAIFEAVAAEKGISIDEAFKEALLEIIKKDPHF